MFNANHRALRQAHLTTTGPLEHPLWDFQHADIFVTLAAAAKDRFVPKCRFADQFLATPGMPGINDLADLSIMGFVLSGGSILLGDLVARQRNPIPSIPRSSSIAVEKCVRLRDGLHGKMSCD
jgi:hypothetical protein